MQPFPLSPSLWSVQILAIFMLVKVHSFPNIRFFSVMRTAGSTDQDKKEESMSVMEENGALPEHLCYSEAPNNMLWGFYKALEF